MLRYVTRRIKDTVERTYNVLEPRHTWTLGNDVYDGNQQQPSKQVEQNNAFQLNFQPSSNLIFEFGFEPKVSITSNATASKAKIGRRNVSKFQCKQIFVSRPSASDGSGSSSSSDKEEFRERIHRKQHYNFQQNVLDALTWSSAVICGWYTSQILCMRRRHLQNGWKGRCMYAKMLMQPSQALHAAVLSHRAKAAPQPQPEAFVWKFNENYHRFREDDFTTKGSVHNVNNDPLKNGAEISAEPKEIISTSIDDAVHNLLQVLGDIEYQLGVESVHSNRYDLAVSHFKLATSHNHASAAYNLGVCYEEGIGVEKDLKMALECYLIASSLGHSKAIYNVGVFHAQGLANLPKNRKAARQYFIEAAKLGLCEANRALGIPVVHQQHIDEPQVVKKLGKVANLFQSQPVAIAVS